MTTPYVKRNSSDMMTDTLESPKKQRLNESEHEPEPEVSVIPSAPLLGGEPPDPNKGYDVVDTFIQQPETYVREMTLKDDRARERIEATMDVDDFDIVAEQTERPAEPMTVANEAVEVDEDSEVKSELFRHLSDKLMSFDDGDVEVDGEFDQTDGFDALTYLRNVEDETRLIVANYLSTGSLSDVKLTRNNIHHVYHVALGLNLRKLRKHCHTFCVQGDKYAMYTAFTDCSCFADFKSECDVALTRSESIVSNSDQSVPPEFYVVFTGDENMSDKHVKVVVIEMSERAKVLQRRIKKPFQFSNGFRTCGCDIDQSPYVFFSGGAGKSCDVMWKYDVISGDWKKSAKMLHGRSKHAMVAPNDRKIFVLGGYETRCIEEYDIASNKWIERGSLLTHVASSIYIVYGFRILLFGGKTASGPVATVQGYDMMTHKVDKFPDLPCSMFSGKAVALGGKIYIASGQGHMCLFDPETGASELLAMQPVVRTDFGMFVRNGRIYLVGGVLAEADRKSEATPQYRYNPVKDEWVEKYKLCENLRVLSASIVRYPKYCPIVPFNDQI